MIEASGAVEVAEVERLRVELAATRAEIVRLQEENRRLAAGLAEPAVSERNGMGVHRSERAPRLFPAGEVAVGEVHAGSSPEDKVHLFRALFAGRADVYAERWENPSTKRSGWSPVTLDRRRSEGPRRYAPLDEAVLGAHLSGRVTAGVYPLIDGDRCWFLACDFDKGTWGPRRVGVPRGPRRRRRAGGSRAVTLGQRRARLGVLR